MKKTPFKSILKKYAPTFAGAAIIIGGITSAALTEIPSSLPASVSDGDIIEASHISDVFSAIRILDDRTDGDTPVDGVDLASKDYVDNEITTVTSDLASTSYVDTQVSNAGGETIYHAFGCRAIGNTNTSDTETYYFEGGEMPDSFLMHTYYTRTNSGGSTGIIQKFGDLITTAHLHPNGSQAGRVSSLPFSTGRMTLYEDRIVLACDASTLPSGWSDQYDVYISYR